LPGLPYAATSFVKTAGIYYVSGFAEFYIDANDGLAGCYDYTTSLGARRFAESSAVGNNQTVSVVDLVTVSANDQIGLWCYSGNGDGLSGVESAAITAILINSASDLPRKAEHSHESQTHLKQRERAQHF
jgi:hypothetical protein